MEPIAWLKLPREMMATPFWRVDQAAGFDDQLKRHAFRAHKAEAKEQQCQRTRRIRMALD